MCLNIFYNSSFVNFYSGIYVFILKTNMFTLVYEENSYRLVELQIDPSFVGFTVGVSVGVAGFTLRVTMIITLRVSMGIALGVAVRVIFMCPLTIIDIITKKISVTPPYLWLIRGRVIINLL